MTWLLLILCVSLNCSPLICLSFLSCSLVSPLCLPTGTQREKGGLGAVCLKPSRFNLLRPSTVKKKKKKKIVYPTFLFSFLLRPFSREKWLPSLFCFSSLNQGNDRKVENLAVMLEIFLSFLFALHWLKVSGVAGYAAACPLLWRTAGCELLSKDKVPTFARRRPFGSFRSPAKISRTFFCPMP